MPLNMRWTDSGHVRRGQNSTKLVPKPYITEAGNSLPRESPPQLQSSGSFLQHRGPLENGNSGMPYGGEADGKCMYLVLAG